MTVLVFMFLNIIAFGIIAYYFGTLVDSTIANSRKISLLTELIDNLNESNRILHDMITESKENSDGD